MRTESRAGRTERFIHRPQGTFTAIRPQANRRLGWAPGCFREHRLRLAQIDSYTAANRYLEEHYLAAHNRRYAQPAASDADYHRRRPTARQLEEVFQLEEERVVSEDWVVRYKNRLLQLERQSRHWAPAKSRVLVRENEAGQLQIRYREQRLPFFEVTAASARKSVGRGAAPSPAPHPRRHVIALFRQHVIRGDRRTNK